MRSKNKAPKFNILRNLSPKQLAALGAVGLVALGFGANTMRSSGSDNQAAKIYEKAQPKDLDIPKISPEVSADSSNAAQTEASTTTKVSKTKTTQSGNSTSTTAEQPITTRLKYPSESLPGYGREVGPEDQKQLKESNVVIARRLIESSDPNNDWVKFMNGNKTDIPGIVQTDAHGFGDGDVRDGYHPHSHYSGNKAVNMTKYSKFEYALFDETAPGGRATNANPIARVSEISVSITDNLDLAYLKIDEATAGPAYKNKPGLAVANAKLPQPGTAAFLYNASSAPGTNEFSYNSANGIFLGEIIFGTADYKYAAVGVRGTPPANKNACATGGSGSAIMIGNVASGPRSATNVVGAPAVTDRSPEQSQNDRNEINQKLGMDTTGEFPTICLQQMQGSDVSQAVMDGFNNHMEPDKK